MPVALVTGASGAIGQRLVPALRNGGWRVRALVHRMPVAEADEEAPGDLERVDTLAPALAGVDVVVHLAAVTHARREADYLRVNRDGTAALATAADAAGVRRFVHASTRAACREGGWYAASKLASEQLLTRHRFERVVVRLPELLDSSGEGISDIVARAREGRPIFVVGAGGQVICPLMLDDVIGPLAAAADAPTAEGKTYTLAGDCLTVREFAERVISHVSSSSRIVSVPSPLLAAASVAARKLPLPLYPDQLARLTCAKPTATPAAQADLGFAPQPLAVL